MKDQRERARQARANISGWSEASKSIAENLPKTEFVGYDNDTCDAKVLAIIRDGELVERVTEGEFSLVFDKTVFYGEGGGQVGDNGTVYDHDTMISVIDTKKTDNVYVHVCTLADGDIKVGDIVRLEINTTRRAAIRRNHSTAHLLQAALRAVLGTHVEQAGSYVDENRVRFDFTHFAALTNAELHAVESLVNAHILLAEPISMTITDHETS